MKLMKRILSLAIALLLLTVLFPGVTAASAAEAAFTFSGSGIGTSGSGSGYSISGTALTISESGTYTLTGACADGTVEIKKELTVTLILDNLTLTSATTAPFIFGANTDVTIEAAGTSTLSDTAGSNADGSVIKSKNTSTLTLGGSGTLNLNGNENNGIKGAANTRVIVDGLTLNIRAAKNALSSDGAVIINGGTLSLISGNDAIKSEPDSPTDSTGMVTINGGDITVVSAGDGIQATGIAAINGGTLHFTTGGGYRTALGTDSTKGIKGDKAVNITGGNFYLDCADDALHSNTNLTVEGGVFIIYTGGDALHADYIVSLGVLGGAGPEIDIRACYEGFEGAEIYMYSGTGAIISSDDGINAANSDFTGIRSKLRSMAAIGISTPAVTA